MFVKWGQRGREYQHRRWQKEQPPHRTVIAQLAESHRVDGKSRQRIIAHLGTCREPLDRPAHRIWFYQRCDRVLDGLDLAPEPRAKIEVALAERILRLSAEEIAQHNREAEAWMAAFRPDPLAALLRAWNDASENDRERFLEVLRQHQTVE